MSRDLAQGSSNAPLLPELFHSSVYKPNQGRIVRQMTALVIWVVIALGCYSLYGTLRGGGGATAMAVPAVLLIAGLWFGFRIVNWPRFADFLIAVEAEMNKVTWPSREELIRAAIVVIFTIFFLAVVLFAFDIVWQYIFETVGVTG